MAKCESCGKTTMFGHNRSFSQRATTAPFVPIYRKFLCSMNGRMVRKTLCAKCIRTIAKEFIVFFTLQLVHEATVN